METRIFLVEIVVNETLNDIEKEAEVRARLMVVSGVKSVREVKP